MDDWFKRPGYKNLLVYKLAVIVFDLNDKFCSFYVEKKSRTFDQMIQAGRSGKQNIVEGSLEKSLKSYIKLLGVSRASFGELLEDFTDFLRLRKLPLWDKNDSRVKQLRRIRIGNSSNLANTANSPNLANLPNWANMANNPEIFANLMITLLSMECYLLDKMIKSLEEKFIHDGGYTENLFKKRLTFRNKE
jgi:four helix bundle suffix protein